MVGKPAKHVLTILAKLIQRRSYCGWWAYLIWVLCYLFMVLCFLGNIGARGWNDIFRVWPLFIPVAIVVIQWIRPTILGWALISLPGLLYGGAGVWMIILDPDDLIFSVLFILFVLGGTIGTMYAGWPKPRSDTRAS